MGPAGPGGGAGRMQRAERLALPIGAVPRVARRLPLVGLLRALPASAAAPCLNGSKVSMIAFRTSATAVNPYYVVIMVSQLHNSAFFFPAQGRIPVLV